MIHQPVTDNIIIEIEKDSASSVFHYLKETIDNVYLNPDLNIIDNYIDPQVENIIIKNLVTTSPLTEKDNVKIPKAEKILIDIFIDHLYEAYQGKELVNIYNAFLEMYAINFSTLYWYASKRNSELKLNDFIKINSITNCERLNK